MSWFRSTATSTTATLQNETMSLDEALKVLDPGTGRLNGGPSEGPQDRNRFSQLLLEHGEKHLQDWAVMASSHVVETPTSLGAEDMNGGLSRKRSNGSGTQWSQTPFIRSSSSLGTSRTSDKSSVSTSGNSTKANGSNHGKTVSGQKSASIPTANMGKIEGRLHLCTNSIVFEPNDVSRGIVRCPFSKVRSPPTQDKSVVEILCNKHSVMKANNIIGPYDSIDIPVRFRFHFLHSSPEKFIWTTENLFRIIKSGSKKGPSFLTPEIDEIMKPVLDRPFDTANLVDARESILTMNLRCSLLSPLQSTPGCAIVTNERIYFQPATGVLIPTATKAMNWSQCDVVATARRYRGLRDSAVEIYWNNGTSVLLAFERKREREQIIRLLPKNARCFTDRSFVVEVEREWQLGNISNYDYLLALNSAAGRTFHDLSRYPVFPWVIADYQSAKLDLTDEKTFRDLTKPVGALNEERLEYFRTRLLGMQGMEEAFLYGTHYSAPGYVLYYLVRNMPEHMLCLQNGKFDAPDRMFHSLEHCFSCVLSNHADVKELIPEFYNPSGGFDFLINARGLQLGATQNGDRVHDVTLPPWAKSARDFLKKNRRALDSDICTDKLPRWIDLIFGSKSRGEKAMEASNLFHRMAYLGPDDLEAMGSDEEKFQAELQATEFGIVPDMLFCGPHPLREDPVGTDNFVVPDTGRASLGADGDDGLDIETDLPQGDQHAWEILDRPSQDGSDEFRLRGQPHPIMDENSQGKALSTSTNAELATNQQLATPGGKAKASWSSTRDLSEHNGDSENMRYLPNGDAQKSPGVDKMPRTIPLSGSGDWARGEKRPDDISWEQSFSSHDSNAPLKAKNTTAMRPTQSHSEPSDSAKAWDMKVLSRDPVHGDTVSGCSIVYEPGSPNRPYLTTVSLDGRLMVHSVSLGVDDSDEQRKNILGTFSRFTSMGISRDSEPQNSQVKLNPHRSHTASDPLACLVLASDCHGGFVAFAGGHDDVVLAYGMNSACAVASVYSHRDAVTGLDLIERNHMGSSSAFWSEKATHIMVSGSWDATVKVWSVAVSAGETVSINREPLAELFDADSTIVCVSARAVYSAGILICAGCADGSFVVWLCHDNGVKEVIHKEPARRGAGPCSAVKWVSEAGAVYLYTCFSSGRVASFVLDDQKLSSVSAVSLGVPVTCLEYSNRILLAGCSDGGLRLIPIRSGCSFDSKPTLWNAVNGKASPGLTCISISISSHGPHDDMPRCICSTGAEDGSVVLFELKRVL